MNLPMSFVQQVWRLYCDSCAVSGEKAAAYKTFCKYWMQLLPHIRVGKPMTDLCWTCQQNSTLITRSINKSEEEKSQVHNVSTIQIIQITKLYKLCRTTVIHINKILIISCNHCTSCKPITKQCNNYRVSNVQRPT